MTIAPFVANVVGDQLVRYGKSYLSNLYSQYDSARNREYANADLIDDLTRRPRYSSGYDYTRVPTPGPAFGRSRPQTMRMFTRYKKRMTFKRARRYSAKTYPANRATLPLTNPRAEIKAHFSQPIVGFHNATGTIATVMQIQQGAGQADRSGFVIKVLDIKYRINMIMSGGVDANQLVRIIFFKWNQGYASPSVTSVLNTPNINSLYSQEEARNVKILSDKVYTLQVTAGVQGAFAPIRRIISGRLSVSDMITFQSTSFAVPDKGVHVIVIANLDTVGSTTINCSTRFIDM